MKTTTATKERPIAMRTPSSRAILEGRKSQTRRAIKLAEFHRTDTPGYDWMFRDRQGRWNDYREADLIRDRCPYGKPGDRLYVKETWARGDTDFTGGTIGAEPHEAGGWPVYYRADGERDRSGLFRGRWSSGRFMPRWASRITLEVTDVRVQRLQEISEEDAIAEGADLKRRIADDHWFGWGIGDMVPKPVPSGYSRRDGFRYLWDIINGDGSWAADPWVWAISFRRIEGAAS